MLTAEAIKARALEIGFDLCGIAPVAAVPELSGFRGWLDRGFAGEMGYLARTADKRLDPRKVLPSARSVIVTGTVYNVDRPYSTQGSDPRVALISRYAWGADYHDVLRARAGALLSWMRATHGSVFDARAYVDTGPIQEKVFAQYAGIGWVGKNSCVINPRLGSWAFLSVILCSLDLEPDQPSFDQCGTCTLCIEACPTGALIEPRVLDARRCLSYLTIELRGPIPEGLRRPLGTRVFGCDVCQDVCPWNAGAACSRCALWLPRPGLDRPRLIDLWRRDDPELAAMVGGTPLTRPKLVGLRRNLAVAIGNSNDPEAAAALAPDSGDEVADGSSSRYHPLVCEHVEWAVVTQRTKGLI